MNRNISDLTHATAHDSNGEKLGSIKEVYINDTTGQPDFVEVAHGLFGRSSSIVPLRGHRLDGDNLQLAFPKNLIKDAPDIRDDEHLSEEDHATIYRHFGLDDTPTPEAHERHVFDDSTGDRFDRDPADPHPGTDTHDPGDHRDMTDAPADRLRAESDHHLGLDRTPEDRAARGTSAHGMSDEPREQYRDYETAERTYAKEAGDDSGARLRRYRVQPVNPETDDRADI